MPETQADPISVDFNGTRYVLGHLYRDEVSAISEFAPIGQPAEACSTLLTFQHFPDRPVSAQETAQQLIDALKENERGSDHDLTLAEGAPEAYLAYVAADSPTDPEPEFTLQKFGPDASGTGVVILQISERMGAEDRNPEFVAERRTYWLQRLHTVDLEVLRSWFVDVYPPQ